MTVSVKRKRKHTRPHGWHTAKRKEHKRKEHKRQKFARRAHRYR